MHLSSHLGLPLSPPLLLLRIPFAPRSPKQWRSPTIAWEICAARWPINGARVKQGDSVQVEALGLCVKSGRDYVHRGTLDCTHIDPVKNLEGTSREYFKYSPTISKRPLGFCSHVSQNQWKISAETVSGEFISGNRNDRSSQPKKCKRTDASIEAHGEWTRLRRCRHYTRVRVRAQSPLKPTYTRARERERGESGL